MKAEQIGFFLRLHAEDYASMVHSCRQLSLDQIWTPNPEAVSVANLVCHVCEMETFWIDQGLCGDDLDRDRQFEFDRNDRLSVDALCERMSDRCERTQDRVRNLSDDDYQRERQFHGDPFTGAGILTWHMHHLGLHRGHVQTQVRWHLR